MDIWYIEWKHDSKSSIDASNAKAKVVCFAEATSADFVNSLELDELFNREVRLVPDMSSKCVFFDMASRKFFKLYDVVIADEFPAYAMKATLETGNVFKKIDWKCNMLSQKELIQRMLNRLVADIKTKSEQDFLIWYN